MSDNIQLGRADLARFIVNGTYSGPTHAIAASLMLQRGDDLRMYVLEDVTGGPLIESFVCHYHTVIDALDKLAALGGERLDVASDGTISFIPDF